MVAQHVVERHFGVHRPGVDGEAGAFGGKPAFRLGEAELVADEVHQVCLVFPVVDRKAWVEADLAGILA
jgi:hypothetical protein